MRTATFAQGAGAGVLLAAAIHPAIAEAQDRSPPAVTSTSPMPLGVASPPAGGPGGAPPREEVPFGYFRDARGKLMQTDFDMNRRFWIGGGYSPAWQKGKEAEVSRGSLELGLRAESLGDNGKWRGRYRLFESRATLGKGFGAHGTLFAYDESRESDTPLLRLTTFWPRPERHDLFLNVGFWGELLEVGYRPRGAPVTELRPLAFGMTYDLWHSADLEDYVRVKVGGGFDDLIEEGEDHRWAATAIARLESDIVIDRRGFHRITADVGADVPLLLQKPVSTRLHASASLGYEVILLAINDQPVTLRLGGSGGYRNDLPVVKPGFELGGDAALRVNLWAPAPKPRDPEPSNAKP